MKAEATLALCYYFPPMGTVASQRNYHLLSNLSHGHSLPVITARHRYSISKDHQDMNRFELFTCPNYDYRIFGRWFNRSPARLARKSSMLRKLLDSFPTNIFFGEGGIIYILTSYYKAKRLVRERGVGIIYSSYRPHADHVTAFLLKRRFSHLKWVADFADLPIDPVIDNVYLPRLQGWCYHVLLRNADLITSVSQGLVSLLKRFNANTLVIPNGLTGGSLTQKNIPHFEKFTISYTGSLYGNRNPSMFLKALSSLIGEDHIDTGRIQLIYAGSDGALWREYLQKNNLSKYSIDKGMIDHASTRDIQIRSHINLLLSWASNEVQGWLTYKLYEYIMAGRPILACVSGEMDEELRSMIEEYNKGLVVKNHASSITAVKKFILAVYRDTANQFQSSDRTQSKFFEQYNWSSIGRRLTDCLRALSSDQSDIGNRLKHR